MAHRGHLHSWAHLRCLALLPRKPPFPVIQGWLSAPAPTVVAMDAAIDARGGLDCGNAELVAIRSSLLGSRMTAARSISGRLREPAASKRSSGFISNSACTDHAESQNLREPAAPNCSLPASPD